MVNWERKMAPAKPSPLKPPVVTNQAAVNKPSATAAAAPIAKPGPEKLPIEEPDKLLWDEARQKKRRVSIDLVNGRNYTGEVIRHGRYSVLLRTDGGPVLLFKMACASAILCQPGPGE